MKEKMTTWLIYTSKSYELPFFELMFFTTGISILWHTSTIEMFIV